MIYVFGSGKLELSYSKPTATVGHYSVLASSLVPHVVSGGLEDVSEGQRHSELTVADFNLHLNRTSHFSYRGTSTQDPLSTMVTM